MKILLIAVAVLGLTWVAEAQRPGQRVQRKAQQKAVEGVSLTKNTVTAKPGYELVRESDTIIAVKKKKKKKDLTGKIRCGCVGNGGCSLNTNDHNASCTGSCGDGCTLYVEQTSVKSPDIR